MQRQGMKNARIIASLARLSNGLNAANIATFSLIPKLFLDLFVEHVPSDCDDGSDDGYKYEKDEKKYHSEVSFIF